MYIIVYCKDKQFLIIQARRDAIPDTNYTIFWQQSFYKTGNVCLPAISFVVYGQICVHFLLKILYYMMMGYQFYTLESDQKPHGHRASYKKKHKQTTVTKPGQLSWQSMGLLIPGLWVRAPHRLSFFFSSITASQKCILSKLTKWFKKGFKLF